MSYLNQYREEFHVEKGCLDVVVCIYHKMGTGTESPVNELLEGLQRKLKGELGHFEEIQVAYVYETPALDAKDFEVLKEETPYFYKEPCRNSETHNLAHVWFLGLALLEKKQRERKEAAQRRLYLVTDEPFRRAEVNRIVEERQGKLFLNPRFQGLQFTPYLIKAPGAGGDLLEKYIVQASRLP